MRLSPHPAVLAAAVMFCASMAHADTIERQQGVWVEGPGYDVTYGPPYETCAARCLAQAKCVMIEYYRPEKKCNLYDRVRPRLKGGSSIVGLRKAPAPGAAAPALEKAK